MDPSVLFLQKRRAICHCCSRDQSRRTGEEAEFDLLVASGHLREMFFGTPRLLDVVNQVHRRRLRFRCLPLMGTIEGTLLNTQPDGFEPINLESQDIVERSVDAFLKEPIAHMMGENISVYDVIDYAANVAGGIHAGSPDRRNQRVTAGLDYKMAHDVNYVTHMLAAIGRIFCLATVELANAVQSAREVHGLVD